MFISVIVPMYNAERFLDASLDALASQDHPSRDYEILLVDNGSTDRSAEIACRFERVTLLTEARPGAYAARNRGIAEARGDVIAFTDPDCVVDRSWVRAIAAVMADPEVELLCGRRLPGSRSRLLGAVSDYENTKDAYVLASGNPEIYYGYTSNMAVRRRLFAELGPFEEVPRGADALFVQRVAREQRCSRIRHAPSVVVTHLELDRLSTYYRKVFLYGRHRRLNQAIGHSRPLSRAERLSIYRRTLERGGYSPARAALLLGALIVGGIAWQAGSASARHRNYSLRGHPTGAPG